MTSLLIESWVRHYPPDVFPAVWKQFENGIARGKLKAVAEVYRELEQHGDELFAWAKARRGRFIPLTSALQRRAARILAQFPSLAKADSTRRNADPFVVALAAEEGLTVVTYELSRPTKPRIPDVCRQLKIPCIAPVELFRTENWQF